MSARDCAECWIWGWPVLAVTLWGITRIQKAHIQALQQHRDYWYEQAVKWQGVALEGPGEED